MKSILTAGVLLCLVASASCQAYNTILQANWDDNTLPLSGDLAYNDCWGYDAPNGTEVAILGTLQRVYFFDVTDPTDPVVIDSFNVLNQNGTTNSSIWRDFKTYDHYAYACADQGTSGLLIFDLQYVPDSVVLVNQTQSFFLRSHNIYIDVDNARLYTCGSNSNSNGTTILDLGSNPEVPVQLGAPTLPLGYVHDIHVVNNIGYASHGNAQALAVYDFSDPNSPVLMQTFENYPDAGYNHSSWLDDSGTRLVFADETHGKSLKLVNPNIQDPQTTNYHLFRSNLLENDSNSIAHNPFILGDLCYLSYYHDGVQIFDISDSNNIQRVAYYDTYSNTNYNGYEGCWGVYPFLQSGVIIASDISNGLFLITIADGILPIDFISFDAVPDHKDVRLQWKVTGPEDGESFLVEHSTDGVQFEHIGEVAATQSLQTYNFVDHNPGPGVHYYRVTVRYSDGRLKSSVIRSVQLHLDGIISIRNTVVRDILHFDVNAPGELSIIAMDGKELYTQHIEGPARTEINLGRFPAGIYDVLYRAGSLRQGNLVTKI